MSLVLILFLTKFVLEYWEYILVYAFFGATIYYAYRRSFKQARNTKYQCLIQDFRLIDKMTGIEFENCLEYIFQRKGYHVDTTPVSNDYGADLILKKNGIITVVQAKRYKDKVGVKAVQEVYAAIPYYKASNAMVVTNSYFTTQAKNLAYTNHIQLIDRDKLTQLIRDIK